VLLIGFDSFELFVLTYCRFKPAMMARWGNRLRTPQAAEEYFGPLVLLAEILDEKGTDEVGKIK